MTAPLTAAQLAPVPDDPAAALAAELLCGLGAGHGDVVLRVPPAPGSGAVADWAGSGAMALTGAPDGPPLVAPGRPATLARAGVLALSALLDRPLPLQGHRLLGERAALAGLTRKAPWSANGSCRAVRCLDGWVALSLARPDDLDLVPALVRHDVPGPAWAAIDRWAATTCVEEVVADARLLGLCAGAVPADDPAPIPLHDCTSSGVRRSAFPDDVLVVDLSALWAGPLCAHLLGLAGARVVRVESAGRPDGGRVGCPAFDDLLHAGQPSVALPFATPAGRDLLRALVDRADVVVTSARPRALEQLGLDVDAWLASRSDGVWVSVTAHPEPDRVGYGDDAALSAGILRRTQEGVPFPCGDALADPLTGIASALAAVAGLWGGGRHHVRTSLWAVARSSVGALDPAEAGRTASGWSVAGAPVAEPRARPARGAARPLGADTEQVLRELLG